MAYILKLDGDFEYLVSPLAMEVAVDRSGNFCYMTGDAKKVKLRPDLPTRVFNKHARLPESVTFSDYFFKRNRACASCGRVSLG
jgi:hypothetical protein